MTRKQFSSKRGSRQFLFKTTDERMNERIEMLENRYDNQRLLLGLLLLATIGFTIAGSVILFKRPALRHSPHAVLERTADFILKSRNEKITKLPPHNRWQLDKPGNQGGYFYYNQQWVHVDEDGVLEKVQWV